MREVKRESSVSFDILEPQSTASVKRKRVKRELEVNGEHPKKQVPSDKLEYLHMEKTNKFHVLLIFLSLVSVHFI